MSGNWSERWLSSLINVYKLGIGVKEDLKEINFEIELLRMKSFLSGLGQQIL